LARLQGTLLDRIHFPDLVRLRGPGSFRSRLAPRGRRGLVLFPKAALQGALTGEVDQGRLLAAQLHEDIRRAPTRMEFVQRQGLR
jgi:hypothetical protein